MGPEKNSLYSGAIGIHLGEIWGFEIFKITVFEPSLAMPLQKSRNNINLQLSGVVELGWDYKMTQKISGKGPPQGTWAPG